VRSQTYCQIATLVANDLPRALLYETQEVTAYHGNLQNFKVSPKPKDFSFGAADWALKKQSLNRGTVHLVPIFLFAS
jgi:hypothetical protein